MKKSLLFATFCATALIATAQNPFTYGLTQQQTENGTIRLKYNLNANAQKVTFKMYDINDQQVAAIQLPEAAITKAEHEEEIVLPVTEAGTYTWSLAAQGEGVSAAVEVGSPLPYTFWSPYGIAIDNNTESAHFGRILVTESQANMGTAYWTKSEGVGAGLYEFDPQANRVANPTGAFGYNPLNFTQFTYTGGALSSAFHNKKVRISKDGRIFVGVLNTVNNPIYTVNPDNLNEWTPVFEGAIETATGSGLVQDADGNMVTTPADRNGFIHKLKRDADSASRDRLGLTEIVAPIVINGNSMGTIVAGPILKGPVDEEAARRCAGAFNTDPDSLIALLNEVKCMNSDMLYNSSELLKLIASSVSDIGEYKAHLTGVANFINEKLTNISASMQELTATANNVNINQGELNRGIQEVNEISGKINEFTSLIKDIAKQTRLLGLNASIEAARAGTAGAGFSVVAEEIGKLAGSSSDTVDKIQEITARITIAVNETVQKGEQTAEIVSQQTEAIEKSTQDLVELSMSASELYNLAK